VVMCVGRGAILMVSSTVSGYLVVLVLSCPAEAQFLNRFRFLPELRREPYHDGKVPVAARLVKVAGRFAADGRSDRSVDVAGSKPITRRPRAIDLDLHRRLAERGEDGEIGNPRHRGS